MNEDRAVWSEELAISASMVDHKRVCRMDALCNILQEVAGRHADALRLGFFDMEKAGLFWALSRLRVHWTSPPVWQQKVIIQTWVHLMRGPLSFRNFSIINPQTGQEIGSASTLWSAVDRKERKPAHLPHSDFPVFPDRRPTCNEPERLQIPGKMIKETTYQVKFSDLDMIRHVNNVRYVTWLIDTYGKFNLDHRPYHLDVNYLSETTLGDSVLLQKFHSVDNPQHFRHRILQAGSAREVIRAAIEWRSDMG